ncbi:28S ribosomal protein S18b, mitochondrial isoform X2 [Boleophthalmus pectinirostris]|uniref:28S ribosomal protein S18b, mitochondrial isoform X2 n=1 Tax=Boleophthalmus pectinirostris TaxID=150288 RepID=UPI000A1C6D9A|nr:28S ribosomal protein S18b, mitochondrial isoform X2 [Boleophthalmus pectinirostris]
MAASVQSVAKVLWRLTPSVLHPLRIYQPCVQKLCPRVSVSPVFLQSHSFCQAASLHDEAAAQAAETLSRYKEKPWEYLESEEYIEKYGSSPVWTGYRRNHKGGIPPQKTRKTCIRGDKICGNPCPICRDVNIIIHPQNVKLLEQFISPYTGIIYDPTKTGVCMKQQKKLTEAIDASRDHGFLPFQIPYVDFTKEDYSNSHDAVGATPPPASLTAGESWYKWYGEITPDESEVTKVKRKYKAYLK